MKNIVSSNNIYVAQSPMSHADRGVFAQVNIKKGETIEICPFIQIPADSFENLGEHILLSYVYFFGKEKERALLALGFGSLYNHTYTPNAMYKIQPRQKTITFISIKTIKKNEEITVNYNQESPASPPLWFET